MGKIFLCKEYCGLSDVTIEAEITFNEIYHRDWKYTFANHYFPNYFLNMFKSMESIPEFKFQIISDPNKDLKIVFMQPSGQPSMVINIILPNSRLFSFNISKSKREFEKFFHLKETKNILLYDTFVNWTVEDWRRYFINKVRSEVEESQKNSKLTFSDAKKKFAQEARIYHIQEIQNQEVLDTLLKIK